MLNFHEPGERFPQRRIGHVEGASCVDTGLFNLPRICWMIASAACVLLLSSCAETEYEIDRIDSNSDICRAQELREIDLDRHLIQIDRFAGWDKYLNHEDTDEFGRSRPVGRFRKAMLDLAMDIDEIWNLKRLSGCDYEVHAFATVPIYFSKTHNTVERMAILIRIEESRICIGYNPSLEKFETYRYALECMKIEFPK